jgi:hypothetical protein
LADAGGNADSRVCDQDGMIVLLVALRSSLRVPHTVGMSGLSRAARPVVLAGMVAALTLVGGAASWRAASATTRVLDRGDVRFDVVMQRRTEGLDYAGDYAGARIQLPAGQPRLSAAQVWSITGAQRQPQGRKPSVRLATFVDPDFGVPAGPGRRLVPVAKRALVWVVVVPDVPVVAFGPDMGQKDRPARQDACPTYTPVDAMTGQPLGTWHHC